MQDQDLHQSLPVNSPCPSLAMSTSETQVTVSKQTERGSPGFGLLSAVSQISQHLDFNFSYLGFSNVSSDREVGPRPVGELEKGKRLCQDRLWPSLASGISLLSGSVLQHMKASLAALVTLSGHYHPFFSSSVSFLPKTNNACVFQSSTLTCIRL